MKQKPPIVIPKTIPNRTKSTIVSKWDMLGAPSNIAGAPSNSMKGQFCPSVKNIKSISFLPGSILSFSHCGSSAKSFFSSLFPDKLLLRELLRQPLDPFASR